MLAGVKGKFAIESEIYRAYERPSLMALGFFIIYLNGFRYGVREKEASLLACSFDEAGRRIDNKGRHTASFATEPEAEKLAEAAAASMFGTGEKASSVLGVAPAQIASVLHGNGIVWAPDGDQAFDDGSCILQFDEDDRVRLVGFKLAEDGRHDPATVQSVWLPSNRYYELLGEWRTAFLREWISSPKASENP